VTTWALLAPGPSATAEQAEAVHAARIPLGVISSAYPLAPHAAFIAATDSKWWRAYPDALKSPAKKFTMHSVRGVEHVRIRGFNAANSGVLGLEVAKRQGATRILLLGFDMHGTHFFGRYTNGLTNTVEKRRRIHLQQYLAWSRRNPAVEVINCTPGSALECFPRADVNEFLHFGRKGSLV
jgi:hypothetical protein